MSDLLWAMGCVLCFEGLVFALLPRRIDDIVELMRRLPFDTRRLIGLTAGSVGLLLIFVARNLGG